MGMNKVVANVQGKYCNRTVEIEVQRGWGGGWSGGGTGEEQWMLLEGWR